MGIIEHRRSIRSYTNEPITDYQLQQIICAGFLAPSPKNRRPWYYIAISNPDKSAAADIFESSIKKLINEKPDRQDILQALETVQIIRSAAVLIIVCYKCGSIISHDDGIRWPIQAKDVEAVELQAVGASVQNMLLKADELGLGGLWCGDILYAYQSISDFLSVPYPIVSAVCIGHTGEKPEPRQVIDLSDSVLFI